MLYKTNVIKENSEDYVYEKEFNNLVVNNDHDKIFRKILDDKEEAIKFINKTLKLENKITKEKIEKYNSSFVSENLRNEELDIIYKIKGKNIFFLIEHQTKIDYRMPLRILEYEIEIIKSAIEVKEVERKEYKYPLVIAIVLYTGRRKWNAKTYIKEVQENLKGYKGIEFARYNLVDVNDYSEEELLKEKSFISKAMLIEKSRYTNSLSKNLEKIIEEMNKEKSYTKYQKNLLITIINLTLREKLDEKEVIEMIRKLREGGGDNMLAVLDMIREENERLIARGERKGIKKSKKEIAKNMIKRGTDIEFIKDVTGLTNEEIEKLYKK